MTLLLLIVGAIAGAFGGFFAHSFAMKVNCKQRTIDNKIKVYDSLIITWANMRNFIYANLVGRNEENLTAEIVLQFDALYGESQKLIGEATLICEDDALTTDINELNERFYRTVWHTFSLEESVAPMEQFKIDALSVVVRMRGDIKATTRLELQDVSHMLAGFRRQKRLPS